MIPNTLLPKLPGFLFCMFFSSFSFTGLSQPTDNRSGKTIAVNGANIFYQEEGKGAPLILLHGFAATGADWTDFVKDFSKNYRVITWDMRGHGKSTNPDTSQVFLHATAARDLLALIDALKLEKVNLIGHSSGGMVALYAATMRPEAFDGIVVMSAQIYYSDTVRSFIKQMGVPDAFYQSMGLEKRHGSQKGKLLAKQFYHFHILKGDPMITPEQLGKIKARTLIIHGDNDFVPVSQGWQMFNYIPGAFLYVVPNGGHVPHIGEHNRSEFTRRTSEFFRGDWSKSAPPK